MSGLPPIDDEAFLISPNDMIDPALIDYNESWSSLYNIYEEILLQSGPPVAADADADAQIISHNYDHQEVSTSAVGQQDSAAAVSEPDKGLERKKIRRSKNIHHHNHEEEREEDEEGSSSKKKKMDHNAKERIRRMKINASYLALRALLPPPHQSTRSKKKWSAPTIVDRVIKYIPELETKVQSLKSQKENLQQDLSLAAAKHKNNILNHHENRRTVSVNRLSQDEAVIQICISDGDRLVMRSFADLMESVEELLHDQGLIKSASTVLCVCSHEPNTLSCHLHILQINRDGSSNCIEQVISRIQS